MKIVVHAGMGKTGTSALQRSLSRARSKLADDHVVYPQFHAAPSHAALSLLCLDTLGYPSPRGYRNMATDEISRISDNAREVLNSVDPNRERLMILSTEYIFYWPAPAQEKLKAMLSAISEDIEVFCWVRHPVDYYISLIGQRAKTVGGVQGMPPVAPEDFPLDIERGMQRLKDVWPVVHAFPFNKTLMADGDIVADFQEKVLARYSDVELPRVVTNVGTKTTLADMGIETSEIDVLKERAMRCYGSEIAFYETLLPPSHRSEQASRTVSKPSAPEPNGSQINEKVSTPEKAPTLDRMVAFNAGYREAWREYFGRHTSAELAEKLATLTAGMDELSRLTCEHQVEIAPYFFPHRLLKLLTPHTELENRLLPREIRADLRRFGFRGKEDRLRARFQKSLGLPELPLPEVLVHSGLAYVEDRARSQITGRTVIDAGAYIGDTAKLFQQVYGAEKVFAIEPDEDNFSRMCALCKDWDLTDRIVPVQAATGREAGRMKLWGAGVGTSSVQKAGTSDADGREVPVITVDDLVVERQIEDVAMIKLDVEGSEFDTILGARKTITQQRPILLISIYHTARDFFEVKPLIESWDLGYTFSVRKITTDLIKEFVLICMPPSEK